LMRLENAMRRLAGNEPLQYVLQKAPFYGRDFFVDQRVLIPRFDSEILVQEALKAIPESATCKVLDCCTGSGCLGLTILAERPSVRMTLSDLSADALTVAAVNAKAMQFSPALVWSDLFTQIEETFSVIVCNPPYIPTAVIGTLDENVRDHEPRIALDGGKDGLHFYRRIAAEAGAHLEKGGLLFLEIGFDQGKAVFRLLSEAGFRDIRIIKDLSGLDRVVKACWNN
ncbi:MAG: peptide chain release factor N(5)-glutamine methyltransferase, partial [Lachnospiraceae bacterium]|nr:peptide chain release factor N(5)-glutamine methyltransferase [Lachnospiraceae bacterium]